MLCNICNKESSSLRYFIWIEESGKYHPYISTDIFVEWLARSVIKHKKISLEQAREDSKKALFSNPAAILKILKHKNHDVTDWKIVYDFVCDDCSNKKVDVR